MRRIKTLFVKDGGYQPKHRADRPADSPSQADLPYEYFAGQHAKDDPRDPTKVFPAKV